MASARRSVQDFMAQVNARTPGLKSGATYATSLNSDGTVAITANGVTLYSKVFWGTGRGVVTDLNVSGDSVMALAADGTVQSGDAQLFINSLV